jgi:hypothetical protein
MHDMINYGVRSLDISLSTFFFLDDATSFLSRVHFKPKKYHPCLFSPIYS